MKSFEIKKGDEGKTKFKPKPLQIKSKIKRIHKVEHDRLVKQLS